MIEHNIDIIPVAQYFGTNNFNNGPLPISWVAPLDRLLLLSLGSSVWFSQYMSYEDSKDFLSDKSPIWTQSAYVLVTPELPRQQVRKIREVIL